MSAPLPRRLRRLPRTRNLPLPAGVDVRVANGFRARVLGLALLASIPPHAGLLLPRTRAIHTFGMRFPIDLLWLRDGEIARVDRAVPPWRMIVFGQSDGVVELGAAAEAT